MAILVLTVRALLRRGKDAHAVWLLGAGLMSAGAVYVFVVEGAPHALALLPVLVVTLILPFSSGRVIRRLAFFAWLAGVALVALNLHLGTSIRGFWFLFGLVIFAAVLALVLRVLVQHHARLAGALAETRSHAATLEAAHGRMKAMEASRARFLNTAAHELRTPMTPLMVQTDLLRKGRLGPVTSKQERALDIIGRNMTRLGDLAQNLLDVARLQADRLVLETRAVDLAEVVTEAVDSFADVCAEKGLRLDAAMEPGLTAEADSKRLSQVLYNLISNAIRHTGTGGCIAVRSARTGTDIEVRVVDTGRGLDPADLPLLFEPFSQLHWEEAAADQRGAGLGLHISRGIVEAHGGRLWCESEGAGKGAVFAFTLPAAPASWPEPAPARRALEVRAP